MKQNRGIIAGSQSILLPVRYLPLLNRCLPGHPQAHFQTTTSALLGNLVTARLAFSCFLCFATAKRLVPRELHVGSAVARLASVTFIFWKMVLGSFLQTWQDLGGSGDSFGT